MQNEQNKRGKTSEDLLRESGISEGSTNELPILDPDAELEAQELFEVAKKFYGLERKYPPEQFKAILNKSETMFTLWQLSQED